MTFSIKKVFSDLAKIFGPSQKIAIAPTTEDGVNTSDYIGSKISACQKELNDIGRLTAEILEYEKRSPIDIMDLLTKKVAKIAAEKDRETAKKREEQDLTAQIKKQALIDSCGNVALAGDFVFKKNKIKLRQTSTPG